MRELLLDQQLWFSAAAANRGIAEGVHTLLSILDGSEASLKAAAHTWLELMAAQALHKFPGLAAGPSCARTVSMSLSLHCQFINSSHIAPDHGHAQPNLTLTCFCRLDPQKSRAFPAEHDFLRACLQEVLTLGIFLCIQNCSRRLTWQP